MPSKPLEMDELPQSIYTPVEKAPSIPTGYLFNFLSPRLRDDIYRELPKESVSQVQNRQEQLHNEIVKFIEVKVGEFFEYCQETVLSKRMENARIELEQAAAEAEMPGSELIPDSTSSSTVTSTGSSPTLSRGGVNSGNGGSLYFLAHPRSHSNSPSKQLTHPILDKNGKPLKSSLAKPKVSSNSSSESSSVTSSSEVKPPKRVVFALKNNQVSVFFQDDSEEEDEENLEVTDDLSSDDENTTQEEPKRLEWKKVENEKENEEYEVLPPIPPKVDKELPDLLTGDNTTNVTDKDLLVLPSAASGNNFITHPKISSTDNSIVSYTAEPLPSPPILAPVPLTPHIQKIPIPLVSDTIIPLPSKTSHPVASESDTEDLPEEEPLFDFDESLTNSTDPSPSHFNSTAEPPPLSTITASLPFKSTMRTVNTINPVSSTSTTIPIKTTTTNQVMTTGSFQPRNTSKYLPDDSLPGSPQESYHHQNNASTLIPTSSTNPTETTIADSTYASSLPIAITLNRPGPPAAAPATNSSPLGPTVDTTGSSSQLLEIDGQFILSPPLPKDIEPDRMSFSQRMMWEQYGLGSSSSLLRDAVTE